jgi:hypothetical protein
MGAGSAGVRAALNALRIPKDREEVFMPIQKSKASSSAKPDKNKKPSKSAGEIGDDDLRSVSGGLASTGGTSTVPDKCISQT